MGHESAQRSKWGHRTGITRQLRSSDGVGGEGVAPELSLEPPEPALQGLGWWEG